MADKPTIITFSAGVFSNLVHKIADNLSSKTGPITATDPEANLVKETVGRGGDQEELLRKLTSLSEKLHTAEGTKKVLEGFGVNKNTLKDKDFRIVFCNSPAGPVCFQGKETKDGLELDKSLPLLPSLPAHTGIVEALLQSQDKEFKPVPVKDGKPMLIAKSDVEQHTVENTGAVGGVALPIIIENLTPQGEKKLTPVIQMIRLADEAEHAQAERHAQSQAIANPILPPNQTPSRPQQALPGRDGR